MVINISFLGSVIHVTMFSIKKINTFDVLTFIQMRTVLTDKKYDFFKVRRMTLKFLTCLKSAK